MGRLQIPWRFLLRCVPPAIVVVAILVTRLDARRSRWFQLSWPAVVFAAFLIELGISRWRRRRPKSWPSAYALVEFAKVSEDPDGGPAGIVLELFYSYQVDGARYGGEYRESFRSQDHARRSLRFFQDLPVPVRYHPRDPSRSVLDPHWLASLATRASETGAAAS